MNEYLNYLNEELNRNQIDLNEDQKELLLRYMEEILEVNKSINLTRIVDPKEFILKHLIDSLLILPFIKGKDLKIIDIGTGGGFPGVPLAIALPDSSFTLLDSTAKKLKVVKTITDKLGLSNIEFLHERAEVAAKDKKYRESFDYGVSRAVALLPILLELSLGFIKPGGSFIALKNSNYKDELELSEKILKDLKGELRSVKEIELSSDLENHVYLEIFKKSNLSNKYPRDYKTIKKLY